MIEFELREPEKIVIHRVVQMSPNNFINMVLFNGKTNAIWCDGVMFDITPHQVTDTMTELARDGKEEHWHGVYFAVKEKYTETIVAVSGLKMSLTFSSSKSMREMVKWLKEKERW